MMTAMETVVSQQKMNKKVMQRNVVDDHATAISKCDALGKVVCMVDDVNDFDNASCF